MKIILYNPLEKSVIISEKQETLHNYWSENFPAAPIMCEEDIISY